MRDWALVAVGAPAPLFWQRAAAAAEPKRGLPILVVIELTGGNDGLNTVVPYADDLYAKARPTLRIEPKTVLKLDDRVGLNPALKDLHKVWESGDLAVVQGAGYPNPNRSHSRSMEIWQTGERRPRARRRLAGSSRRDASLARPVLRGERGDSAGRARPQVLHAFDRQPGRLPDPGGDSRPPIGCSAVDDLAREIRRRTDHAIAQAKRLEAASPGLCPNRQPATLEERLTTIRVLIEHDPGLRVFYTSTAPAGFDTHAAQNLHASRAAADRFPRAVAGVPGRSARAWPGRAGRGADVLRVRPAGEGERPGRHRPRGRGPGLPRRVTGSRRPGRPAHRTWRISTTAT